MSYQITVVYAGSRHTFTNITSYKLGDKGMLIATHKDCRTTYIRDYQYAQVENMGEPT